MVMRILMVVECVTALGAACSPVGATHAPPLQATGPSQVVAARTIVALGDSLTSGRGLQADQAYPSVLQRLVDSSSLPFRVVNHGVSGDTTAGGVRRLRAALDERPAIMIVALGANDGLRGVPIDQVRSNLEKIIEGAQAEGVQVLLCGMYALPMYGWDYTVDFARIYPALAEKYKVPLVPFMLQGVFGNAQEMLQPDFHPNAAGATEIAHTIWPYLQPLLAAQAITVSR
jgi:acyl-CoA thioesterase-1